MTIELYVHIEMLLIVKPNITLPYLQGLEAQAKHKAHGFYEALDRPLNSIDSYNIVMLNQFRPEILTVKLLLYGVLQLHTMYPFGDKVYGEFFGETK